jgi:hypothetical protein
LTSGYDEIARSLFADELSVVGNYEIGEMIGKGTNNIKYRKLALIDVGSFGKVYLAYHTMTKTKVSSVRGGKINSVGRDKSSREIRDGRTGKRDLPSSKATTSSHHKALRSSTYRETCLASYRVLSWYYKGGLDWSDSKVVNYTTTSSSGND